jgi:hypothetical protein
MTRTSIWFLFALLSAGSLVAQDASCADYNPPINVVAVPTQTNSQDHFTGYHYYNSQVTGACSYTDPSTNLDVYCASLATADGLISGGDTGITTSSYHVNHWAQNNTQAQNNDGGSSTTAQTAIAFETCLLTSCSFNVGVGPISFPSGTIWTGSQTYSQTCAPEPNPHYNKGGGGGGDGGGGGNCPCLLEGCPDTETCVVGTYSCGCQYLGGEDKYSIERVERNISAMDHKLN